MLVTGAARESGGEPCEAHYHFTSLQRPAYTHSTTADGAAAVQHTPTTPTQVPSDTFWHWEAW